MESKQQIHGIWDRTREAWRGAFLYCAISLALLAPCFWQPRLGGADLSKHIYNSWMTVQFENGRTFGLMMVHQWTNVLFDFVLSGLLRVVGSEAAQRLTISIVVLTFVWGAFSFVAKVSSKRPWHLMPSIAMLAYGWVFHMGFFNFYLSLGLCFWAMSLAWDWTRWRLVAAGGIFFLAYLAHALPLVWTLGLLAYVAAARGRSPLFRACLTAGFVLGLIVLHAAIGQLMVARWSPSQITRATGMDQVWVFDGKYYLVLIGLVISWGLLFITLVRGFGTRQVVGGIPFQLCVISAAAVSILPGTVLIPGFYHALTFIAERMSLGVAICVCAMLGTVVPRRPERWALAVVAILFFGFLYRDERNQNGFDDQMQNLVAHSLPVSLTDGGPLPGVTR